MNRLIELGRIIKSGLSAMSEGVTGLVGEQFDTPVMQFSGFSSNPPGTGSQSLLFEINGDPDNYVASPPIGGRLADEGTTLISYGNDVDITLSDEAIIIKVGGDSLQIKDGKITTNMDIETTGDVKAGGISLRGHAHIGNQGALTSNPQ